MSNALYMGIGGAERNAMPGPGPRGAELGPSYKILKYMKFMTISLALADGWGKARVSGRPTSRAAAARRPVAT